MWALSGNRPLLWQRWLPTATRAARSPSGPARASRSALDREVSSARAHSQNNDLSLLPHATSSSVETHSTSNSKETLPLSIPDCLRLEARLLPPISAPRARPWPGTWPDLPLLGVFHAQRNPQDTRPLSLPSEHPKASRKLLLQLRTRPWALGVLWRCSPTFPGLVHLRAHGAAGSRGAP